MTQDINRDLSARTRALENILRSARSLLLEGYSPAPGADETRKSKLNTLQKSSPKDLVTFYDKAVEAHLIEQFQKIFPGEKVLGEESVAASDLSALDHIKKFSGDHFWLLDPIDGTTNYSRAYPFFCTTAAFCQKSPTGWQVLSGAVYNPVAEEMFSASQGQGAYLNRQRLLVSETQTPLESLMITGFASQRSLDSNAPFELFTKITHQTLGVRRDGSAALDLSYVAAGRADAYWEWGLSPWDTAAGTLLVQEARGKVSDLSGAEAGLFRGEILATNGFLHKWVLDRIKEIKR